MSEETCPDCGGDGYYKGPRLGDEPCPKCQGSGKRCQHDWARLSVAGFVHHQCKLCRDFRGDVTPDVDEVHELRRQLSAATARASELERMLTAEWGLGCSECGAEWMTDAQLDKLSDTVEPLKALVAQRDTELAAMGERVARLEAAARRVVAADTYPMIGKTRFEATTEAIAELERLLPVSPAVCAGTTPPTTPPAEPTGGR